MTEDSRPADWIAAEFDGARLNVWPMHQREPLTHLSCPSAASGTIGDIISLSAGWLHRLPMPVVFCGNTRVSTVSIPCKPDSLDLVTDKTSHSKITLHSLPGITQSSPCAQIQASGARIAGFMQLNPNWDGVLCLPGAHTHWVHISAGEIVSFQSFLTHSMLTALEARLSETTDLGDADWDREAFEEAVADTMSRPERLAARLAEINAETTLHKIHADVACGRLAGVLIGAELAAARAYWLGQNIALIGDDHLSAPYAAALGQNGLSATIADARRMALEGLIAAKSRLPE
ncbi:MAG: 2-keto-3-deoxy-galactonokinase [Rhodobacteraceae bacterium]|nr:2-keto-3-deoxy-galactonokinase [Paracoccaceae bacterium]